MVAAWCEPHRAAESCRSLETLCFPAKARQRGPLDGATCGVFADLRGCLSVVVSFREAAATNDAARGRRLFIIFILICLWDNPTELPVRFLSALVVI